MTDATDRPRIETLRGRALGRPIVAHRCLGSINRPHAVPFLTAYVIEPDAAQAFREMRDHLADEHGDELRIGRCAVCDRPTDHVRIRAAAVDDRWLFLCENHAPAHQLRRALAGPDGAELREQIKHGAAVPVTEEELAG